jgi:regulatory protein
VALDARTLGTVREAAARHEVQTVAMRLLARRLRSRAELERALRRRGMAPEVVQTVSAALRRDGWLDDERFAQAWVRDRLALQPCGRRRLRAGLAAKGVAPDIAERVIAALLPSSLEDDLAGRQAQARLGRMSQLPPHVARRRLVGWLRRRGFSGDTIARVVRGPNPAGSVTRDDDSAT